MLHDRYPVLMQPVRQIFIRLKILSPDLRPIEEVTGYAISGSYSLSADSAQRRTLTLEAKLDPHTLPSPSSPFWINRRIQLYVGLLDMTTDEIVWFNEGVYVIQTPSVDISLDGSTLSVSAIDLMGLQDGTLSGQLLANTIIDVSTSVPISTAIKTTMSSLGGETRFIIDPTEKMVPCTIEHDAGGTVWDIVEELTNLYMNWQSYYDVNGYFCFRKKPTLVSDMVAWDFSRDNLILSISKTINYDNVRNYVKVIGKLKDDGSQPTAELTVTDSNYPNSPFTVEKLNEGHLRKMVVTDDKYFEQEQCETRCEYEIYLHNNCAVTLNIECVPIYPLEVNQIIQINRPEDDIVGKYAVTQIDCGLSHGDTMSITAVEVY